MSNLKRILVMLLLSEVLAEQIVHYQLIFLNKLIQRIEGEQPIEILVILQHHQDSKCKLDDWNSGIPTLRMNESTKIVVRENFNRFALALVCMGNVFKVDLLLNTLAAAYDNMRYSRIILWTQEKLTKEFLDNVAKQASEHKFVELLLLEMGDEPSGPISAHRLKPFPYSHFQKIEEVLSLQEKIFYNKINFHGLTATVKTSKNSLHVGVNKPNKVVIPPVENMEISEFARRTNLSLKYLYGNHPDTENFDIELTMRFISINNSVAHLGFVNPLSSSSLILIVPCAQEMSLTEIFQQLDVKTWLLYIFYLYSTLVLVETFIQVVICRIREQPHGLTRLDPFVNLRAFRALLGMSFPISRRASLSLRQLFVAMSIFGMVFSSFFSCKLSALLTKHPYKGQVTNLEELRDSGLTVIMDPRVRSFIESEVDADFFQRVIPLSKSVEDMERLRMILSLNNSYAYIIFQENVQYLKFPQFAMTFCTSKELGIINNLPRVYYLQKDSVFRWPLSQFVVWMQEAGITEKWKEITFKKAWQVFKLPRSEDAEQKVRPLSYEHLKWLGYLLILGYGAATFVFIVEVFLGRNRATYRGRVIEV
ncbi:uncharacterized protein [Drosophila kikkawai]|uniref:Uncharacterized protein n=1 Tax=Drosophila kikkawai TaxID=30033 RepID=A0A6P4IKI0_DROKI|nr:uncharacterized protein LOC108075386 [Drosophila kikkawai]